MSCPEPCALSEVRRRVSVANCSARAKAMEDCAKGGVRAAAACRCEHIISLQRLMRLCAFRARRRPVSRRCRFDRDIPDPIGDFIGSGGFDKPGGAVGRQIGIAQFEQVDPRRVGCSHGRPQGSAVIERFDIGDVAPASRMYFRVTGQAATRR